MFETSVYRDDCTPCGRSTTRASSGRSSTAKASTTTTSPRPSTPTRAGASADRPSGTRPTPRPTTSGSAANTTRKCRAWRFPARAPDLVDGKNAYNNPFGTEVGLFRASSGGMSRMLMSRTRPDTTARWAGVRGDKGSVTGTRYEGIEDIGGIELAKPPLPPDVKAGGHGGSRLSDRGVHHRNSPGIARRSWTYPGA